MHDFDSSIVMRVDSEFLSPPLAGFFYTGSPRLKTSAEAKISVAKQDIR